MILIVDYGMGNLRSIQNKLERLGQTAVISGNPDDVQRASKIILPGVGAFDTGMRHLRTGSLLSVLEERVLKDGVPTLGICLGFQLLGEGSAEGQEPGLSWMRARALALPKEAGGRSLRVPHVGWNTLEKKRDCILLDGIDPQSSFYFAHSYFVECDDAADLVASTRYGIEVSAVIQSGNLYGTQFHPEKSHEAGLGLLRNFAERA